MEIISNVVLCHVSLGSALRRTSLLSISFDGINFNLWDTMCTCSKLGDLIRHPGFSSCVDNPLGMLTAEAESGHCIVATSSIGEYTLRCVSFVVVNAASSSFCCRKCSLHSLKLLFLW